MSAEKLPLSLKLKAGRAILFYGSLALLSGLCFYQCLECFLRYDKRQTFVSKEIVEQRKTQVPSTTFCLRTPGIWSCPKANVTKRSDTNVLGKMLNSSENVTEVEANNTIDTAQTLPPCGWKEVNKASEVIFGFYVRFFKYSNELNRHYRLTKRADISSLVKPTPDFGNCFTYNPTPHDQDKGIYYVRFKIVRNVSLETYIHHPDQLLDVKKRPGVYNQLRTSKQFQVSYEETLLTRRELPDGTMSCSESSLDACLKQAGNKGITGICLRPCSSLTTHVGMITTTQYKISRSSRIYVYFPQRVVLSTEGLVYEFTELIGEVGGYIGMLLGFSIMDLALTICQLIAKRSEEFRTKNQF